ncbi:MAG: hypothetical protein AB8F26_04210 [Phycisphaerales bacterium]
MLDDNGRWAWSVTPELTGDPSAEWNIQTQRINAPRTEQAITLLMEAARRPRLGARLEDDDDWEEEEGVPILSDIYIEEVPHLSNVCRFLATAASIRLEQDRPDPAIKLIQSMIDAADLCREYPSGISQIIESASYATALNFTGWALENHSEKLNDEHLAALDAALDQTLFIDTSIQRLVFEDLVRRPIDEPGPASNQALEDLPQPVHSVIAAYDTILECAARPIGPTIDPDPWQCRDLYESVLEAHPEFKEDLQTGNIAWDRTRRSLQHIKQGQLALRLAIAAYRHRSRHAEFTPSIETIDHDLLGFEPIDMITGEHLKYKVVENRPLIYTVGADRDDDGGHHVRDAIQTTNRVIADGDYILFGAQPN